MKKHEKIKADIDRLFGDTSQDQRDTRDQLDDIMCHVETLITALDEQIGDQWRGVR